MTFVHSLHIPRRSALRETFSTMIETLRDKRARRLEFRRVLDELHAMSDRDLADLNISRLSIRDIARQAAYGA